LTGLAARLARGRIIAFDDFHVLCAARGALFRP